MTEREGNKFTVYLMGKELRIQQKTEENIDLQPGDSPERRYNKFY